MRGFGHERTGMLGSSCWSPHVMRRLVALLQHVCGSQWPVRAGALLLPAETVARVRSEGALHVQTRLNAAAHLEMKGSSHI